MKSCDEPRHVSNQSHVCILDHLLEFWNAELNVTLQWWHSCPLHQITKFVRVSGDIDRYQAAIVTANHKGSFKDGCYGLFLYYWMVQTTFEISREWSHFSWELMDPKHRVSAERLKPLVRICLCVTWWVTFQIFMRAPLFLIVSHYHTFGVHMCLYKWQ